MAIIYLDIFDPQACQVLEQAIKCEEKGHEKFEVIPIPNGSILAFLPLLAFAWMKKNLDVDDSRTLLMLIESSMGPSEYWLNRVLGVIRFCGGDKSPTLAENLISFENVRFLSDLLAKSDLLQIKALTMTRSNGRVYIGYGEIHHCLNNLLKD